MFMKYKYFGWSVLLLIFLNYCKTDTSKADIVHEESALTSEASDAIKTAYSFALREGDLLFQDGDCGSFCEAIEKVTNGFNGARLSHVGIVIQGAGNKFAVLEAVSKGVIETSIDSFLNRSFDAEGNPKVLVGRLKPAKKELIRPAIKSALQHRGKAYDAVFDLNNDDFYCSELLYFAFKEANKNTPLFQLRPMTYKDPATKETFPAWVDYFQKLNKPIPENQPGLNPGSMSRSIYLDIVHAYGKPEGFRGLNSKK